MTIETHQVGAGRGDRSLASGQRGPDPGQQRRRLRRPERAGRLLEPGSPRRAPPRRRCSTACTGPIWSRLRTCARPTAATTNLFYVVNWLHDYWYDSGFTEAAGNAQDNNFGRGGEDRDALKARGAGLRRPEQRQHVHAVGRPAAAHADVPVDAAVDPRAHHRAGRAGSARPARPRSARPSSTSPAMSCWARTAAPPINDACEPITNDVAGRIVLVDRGTCSFALKALAIENAGGIGMILANNTPLAPPPGMGQTAPPTVVTIPSLSVTFEDGQNLRTLLGQGPVTAHFLSAVVPPGRDGSHRQHDRRPRVGSLLPPPAAELRHLAVRRHERGLGRLRRAAHGTARG